jgi:undecaprenyl-diphosphatase
VSLLFAALLGLLQGLTEFLPVSSKGHLALAQAMLGIERGGLSFIVLLHLGTLLAICLAYPARVRQLAVGSLRLPIAIFRRAGRWSPEERLAGRVALSTLPAGLVGFVFHDRVATLFSRPDLVGVGLLGTAVVLWTTRGASHGSREVGVREAVIVGLAQAFAILPGVSRSGTTIATALLIGVRRPEAAEFSFLSSIPLVLAAGLLELPHLAADGIGWRPLAVGFVVSAVAGWLAIVWLVRLVRAGVFYRFAPYCAALGLAAITWTLLR